jgi:hypothetical protein
VNATASVNVSVNVIIIDDQTKTRRKRRIVAAAAAVIHLRLHMPRLNQQRLPYPLLPSRLHRRSQPSSHQTAAAAVTTIAHPSAASTTRREVLANSFCTLSLMSTTITSFGFVVLLQAFRVFTHTSLLSQSLFVLRLVLDVSNIQSVWQLDDSFQFCFKISISRKKTKKS